MSRLKLMNTRTRFLLIVATLLLVGVSAFALHGVSADTYRKLGVTEQSRVGALLRKIVPGTFGLRHVGTPAAAAALTPVLPSLFTPSSINIATVDSGDNGYVGQRVSMVVVNGKPAMSYFNVSDRNLMFARNSAADGSGTWTITTVDSPGITGVGTALAIINGLPAIAYYFGSEGSVKYARNSAADGSGVWTVTTVDGSGNSPDGPISLVALSNGKPAIAYLDSVNADLKFARNSAADGSGTWTITTAVASRLAGNFSLAVIAGNPAISFSEFPTTGPDGLLKFARNASADGSGAWTVTTVDDEGGTNFLETKHTSLTTIAGNPAISYHENLDGDLRFARNSAADGSGTWAITTVENGTFTYEVGDDWTSLVVVNGNPAIAYYDQTSGKLKFARNAASDSSGAWGLATVDEGTYAGYVGEYSSITAVAGKPAISYYDAPNSALKYARNGAADGSGAWVVTTVDNTSGVGEHSSLAVVGGNPAISYYDRTSTALKYARNSAADGSGTWTITTVDNAASVGQYTSLAVAGGNPAISYYDATNSALKFARNSAADGTGAWTITTVDNAASVGQHSSLAVSATGLPLISYYDATSGDLKLARNSAADGSGAWTVTTVDSAGDIGQFTALRLINGNAAVSYYDVTNRHLKYARNSATDGSGAWTVTTVDSDFQVGRYAALVMCNCNAALSYHDEGDGDLKYALISEPNTAPGISNIISQTISEDGAVNWKAAKAIGASFAYLDASASAFASAIPFILIRNVARSAWNLRRHIA